MLPPPVTVTVAKTSHFLGFLIFGFGVLAPFFIEGRQPHPQSFCSLSARCFTFFLSLPISLAFAFLNAFLDTSQFLLQLVPVVLQVFQLFFGGKEAAKSRTAPATTTGTPCQSVGSGSYSCLTHHNHPLSVAVSFSIIWFSYEAKT